MLKCKKLHAYFFLFFIFNFAFAVTKHPPPNTKAFIHYMVVNYHVKPTVVKAILNKAQYRADVLSHIKHPFERKPWYQYKALFITPKRIRAGVKFWRHNKDILEYMQHQFRVPSYVVVGILGVETIYGQEMGKYKVLNALNTLAFYYPARTRFFQAQLASYIAFCQKNHIKPTEMLGSYAGAIGQAQFMPTSLNCYAIDAQHKGHVDIMHNEGDVIASVSNFLAKKGWDHSQPAALLADVPAHFNFKKYQKALTLTAWKKLGVTPHYPITHNLRKDKAKLLAMPLKHGKEFWLTFDNFHVIKHYNPSDNYALAVILLGETVEAMEQKHNV